MKAELGNTLTRLARKYECEEFLVGDPSWFMHQIDGDVSRELLAFVSSALSYGSRKQFMPKIQTLLDSILACGNDNDAVSRWLAEGRYAEVVPESDTCFYRLYTCRTFNAFLRSLALMVADYGSIKGFLISRMYQETPEKAASSNSYTPQKTPEKAVSSYTEKPCMAAGKMSAIDAVRHLTRWFREHGSEGVIPKDATSSCKRVCMFLRWMVRDGSPVDLGQWSDIIDRRTLIMPMDTHVVQEAMRLGLLTSRSTSMSNALRLSERLLDFFPDDPLKADFALFGLGVDDERAE